MFWVVPILIREIDYWFAVKIGALKGCAKYRDIKQTELLSKLQFLLFCKDCVILVKSKLTTIGQFHPLYGKISLWLSPAKSFTY